MKPLLYAIGLVLLLSLAGCYGLNSAATTLSVTRSPDGTCKADYSSNKELLGLEAEVCGGRVKVDKSGSSEAIAAGSIANQALLLEILQGQLQKVR